jgi:hypothetical protein
MKLRVLSKHLVRAARRVFGIPDFRLNALANGIKQVLFNRTRGPGTSPRQVPPQGVGTPITWMTTATGGASSPMGRKTALPIVVPAFLACGIWHNGFEISILLRADRGPFF